MKTTYTNEQLQEAIDVAFHESSGDDGFWIGIARAFLDNLPKIHTPAEKPEPETFEAHGKTWTRYTPGDPMPCDGEAMVEVCIGEDLRKRPADKAINWNWEKWTPVRGWRYADETLVTKSDSLPEWTPAVGMSLRDWFAGMALQGKATRLSNPHEHRDILAADCYDIADAMIEAREVNAQ